MTYCPKNKLVNGNTSWEIDSSGNIKKVVNGVVTCLIPSGTFEGHFQGGVVTGGSPLASYYHIYQIFGGNLYGGDECDDYNISTNEDGWLHRFYLTASRARIKVKFSDAVPHGTGTDYARKLPVFYAAKNMVIRDVYMRLITTFSGGDISAYTASVGNEADAVKYMLANDVKTAAGALTSASTKGLALTTKGETPIESFTEGDIPLYVYLNATGDTLANATQGELDVYFCIEHMRGNTDTTNWFCSDRGYRMSDAG